MLFSRRRSCWGFIGSITIYDPVKLKYQPVLFFREKSKPHKIVDGI